MRFIFKEPATRVDQQLMLNRLRFSAACVYTNQQFLFLLHPSPMQYRGTRVERSYKK